MYVSYTAEKSCIARLAVSFTGEINPVHFCFLLKHGVGQSEAINLFQLFLLLEFFGFFQLAPSNPSGQPAGALLKLHT